MAEQDVIQPTQSDIAAIQTSISTSSSNAERDELMKKFPPTTRTRTTLTAKMARTTLTAKMTRTRTISRNRCIFYTE